MYLKINGIVLGQVKVNDRTTIVRIYTRERGLLAFVVAPGSSRAARERAAMLMPLSLVRLEAGLRPGRDLCTMRDLQRSAPLAGIYAHPVKAAIAMMMAEVLTHAIREQERNEALFQFVSTSIQLLDGITAGMANFHLCFMLRLGAFLGIEPDWDGYCPGYWFNMEGGTFVPHPRGSHCLPPDQAAAMALLGRMTFANMHRFVFTREQRNQALDLILQYYRLHNSTLGTLRSPAVLQQLFV